MRGNERTDSSSYDTRCGARYGATYGAPPGTAHAAGPGWPNAVLASGDPGFRGRVRDSLAGMRWRVMEAAGGAEALVHFRTTPSASLIVDSSLPDLEIDEFIARFKESYPQNDLVIADEGCRSRSVVRGPRSNELLHAVRIGQDREVAQAGEPGLYGASGGLSRFTATGELVNKPADELLGEPVGEPTGEPVRESSKVPEPNASPAMLPRVPPTGRARFRLAELIGDHPLMLAVSGAVHLAAPHSTAVLIQGATGTGKEIVARALHRLSPRSAKPFVALNCAAIPESLLETELFGHARGAFTGAVQRRIGRIESAEGGTLFLDEIGDMPLALQAKLLRLVESGELQRVGENETLRVDVRILSATHRPLLRLGREGNFREDLYYRLAGLLITLPSLAARRQDIPLLASHFLTRGGGARAGRRHTGGLEMSISGRPRHDQVLTRAAMEKLQAHGWPGNVRELENVLERAAIFAEGRPEITEAEIVFASDADEF